MYSFAIILWSALIPTCFSQLKACYQATDGELAGDFPCNPDANVSSCCSSGNICSSNLYCISAANQQNYVGTCTDKTWSSPACPFNLTTGAAFNGFYDKFNYQLNTTQCPDGTLCPFADNKTCCDANKGIKEIHYSYNSSAVIPKEEAQLTTFYAAAGYTFPTSIPPATPTPTASSGPGSAKSTTGSSDLGPGAKAGIAIGITLSVVLCTVCVLLLHLRRRRRHQQQQQHHQKQQHHYESDTPKELGSPVTVSTQGYSTELEGTPVGSEMESSQKAQEVHEGKVQEAEDSDL